MVIIWIISQQRWVLHEFRAAAPIGASGNILRTSWDRKYKKKKRRGQTDKQIFLKITQSHMKKEKAFVQTARDFPRRRWVRARLGARGWQRRASCFVYLPPNVQETLCQRSLTKPISRCRCHRRLWLFMSLFGHARHILGLNNSRKRVMDAGCGRWWKAGIFKMALMRLLPHFRLTAPEQQSDPPCSKKNGVRLTFGVQAVCVFGVCCALSSAWGQGGAWQHVQKFPRSLPCGGKKKKSICVVAFPS